MHYALLDDGRRVIVDTPKQPTRKVGSQTFFLDAGYTPILLDGGWQVVRSNRLKNIGWGSPFDSLRGVTR